MNILYESSFKRDLSQLRDKRIKKSLQKVIEQIHIAEKPSEIIHLEKLRSRKSYYKIRIGDYRIGLELREDTFIFVRFLHRRDIYRYFP